MLLAEPRGVDLRVAENLSKLVVKLVHERGFKNVVTVTSAFSKNYIPRVAAMLDVMAVTDVVQVKSADTFVRPVYAGNALATVQSSDAIKLLSVRGTNFEKAAQSAGAASTAIETVAVGEECDAKLTSWVKDELTKSSRPELTSAR